MKEIHVKWKSPSNIALIKYWGKNGYQLPANPSLSMSLSESYTTTEVIFRSSKNDNSLRVKFSYAGQPNEKFQSRIEHYLHYLSENEMLFLKEGEIIIQSENTFPHSTGIASSASFMSSLALCLCSIEEQLSELYLYNFFERASYLARLGSGSAARSVFGGFVSWGKSIFINHSSDEYATPINKQVQESFFNLCDAIIVVSDQPKSISSSDGHKLMNEHPFARARYRQANLNHEVLLRALMCGDRQRFVEIVENEALQLHAMLMSAQPWNILLAPESVFIIQQIKLFRLQSNIPICFTLDAGPNIHLIYSREESKVVKNFLESQLIPSVNKPMKIIYDKIGQGPVKIL